MLQVVEVLARVGIAAAVLSEDRRIVRANTVLLSLLKMDPAEGDGVDIGNILRGKATRTAIVGMSAIYRFGDGASWFRLDLKSDDRGRIGILTDLGREYEPQEEALHYNWMRDQLLIDGKVGPWRYDPDAALYYFSNELNLGHPGAGAPVPVPLLELLQHPDDKAGDAEIRERITREGGTANAEMRYLGADGSWTHLNVHYRAGHKLASGRYEMLGISQDITAVAHARDEANRLSEQLKVALSEADYACRTKTQFLANMSHELRTPLNAIIGFSEVIAGQIFGPVQDKYADYAREIHRSGLHLLSIVNDVLDLAKLEAGKLELHESQVDVAEAAAECLSMMRGRIEAGVLEVTKDLSPEAGLLRADARVVKQILINFLSNAIKFTPVGGCIHVSSCLDSGGGIQLSVRDSGIGMSPGEIEVALAPFGQIDSALARKHQGTGLGLPICKSLMELHGGTISISSAPGAGTTMTAHFPGERTVSGSAAISV
ncbi:MAG: HAMP domain-containing histidine kinase [Proteobacteria bacterium]|nr:HAMP domain-containing histidine kinase [Pseudomonadota bacterium]